MLSARGRDVAIAWFVSWIETTNQRSHFRMRRVSRDGTRSVPVTISELAGTRASGYPRIATFGDQLV